MLDTKIICIEQRESICLVNVDSSSSDIVDFYDSFTFLLQIEL